MRRVAAILAVAGVCAAAVVLSAANGEDKSGKTYKILFDNAFGLTEGGDFKVAGVRGGQTSGFTIVKRGGRPLALVEAEVTEPGLADLREDARCEIRPQSLIGEYFVDCQPGASDEQIPDGGELGVEQTSSTIPIDFVNNIMRLPYRHRLRLIIGELGAGLAGRPEDLSQVLRRAHPALRETSETLRILGRQTDTIEQFIDDAQTVISALENRKGDVVRFVREAGRTAQISASRRDELQETFSRLPAFLAELEPYMGRLGDLTNAQTPVLRDLRRSADELDTFLVRLRPFTRAGLPAFESLGEASVVGRRAVRKTTAMVRELRELARYAPGAAKPLRQFLETIDDRRRAVKPDRRAAATSPPPGDKTHTSSNRAGFTGMEAVWNYFYWQALSTNSLDDVGKVLRLSVQANECSPYTTNPSPELLEECNQFLGPTQPGVTTPDPTRPANRPKPSPGGGEEHAAAALSRPGGSGGASGSGGSGDPSAAEIGLDFLLGE